jgi:hypothetical protein
MPMIRPMARLQKKTKRKLHVASKRLRNPSLWPPFLYSLAVSKRTMAMASFRMDSPKMIVYSFGSTL